MSTRSTGDAGQDDQERGGCLTVYGGLVLTFAGVAATLVTLFDPPAEPQQRVMAAGVAIFGLVTGPGLVGLGVYGQAFLRRVRPLAIVFGWVPGALMVAFGCYLIADPAYWAQSSGSPRIDSPAQIVLRGVFAIVVGVMFLWAWWVRGPRRSRRGASYGGRRRRDIRRAEQSREQLPQ